MLYHLYLFGSLNPVAEWAATPGGYPHTFPPGNLEKLSEKSPGVGIFVVVS